MTNMVYIFSIFFNGLFDHFLTFQAKGTRGRSNKALGLAQHRFIARTLDTGFNCWSLYTISFAYDDNLFPFQLHILLLKFRKFGLI
jgi:putative flippase GtrA